MTEEASIDVIRSAEEVAWRALALFCVTGLAASAERADITDWLSANDLWCRLTPTETAFIDTPQPTRQQTIDASWLTERLIVLLWAMGKVDALPPADEQCDTSVFGDILPPFADVSVVDFVISAQMRQPAELIALADETRNLHWEARDAEMKQRSPHPPVDLGIVEERHHAINWVIGYDGLDWDDVTTDTWFE